MYFVFVLSIGLQRVAELVIARRNSSWALTRGGREYGRGHYPVMVSMHALLLVSCAAEVALLRRPFIAWLGWPMVAMVGASTGVRWWCAAALGKQWNSRVIVVPDAPLVTRGPYRWLHHPNYAAVAVEVPAVALVHSAWLTAIAFSIADAVLLGVRIRTENRALGY
ncbi:isoprenylcysteine carboxyl methyltransferase family protein [Mycobacterium sp. pW049]|uniref:isoprenylcysteine carboxyl methyltransferase family protein n=1 Tax=[Mycobacterium] bulgaricum TaxID=3238985 RepID=UPI00351AE74F